jgi:hypothetical protein
MLNVSSRQRALRWFAAIVLVSASVSVVSAAPAQAASCPSPGSSCTGWDPNTTGCTGISNLEELPHGGVGLLQLRYSSSCRAAWARWTSSDSRGGIISIESTDGIEYQVNLAGYNGEVKWTRMIDFSKTVRACHFAYFGGQGLWACTGWH